MTMWKFVHAADLHLDSPLAGLERYEGAPVQQIRRATRDALVNLVDLCLDEQVTLLLIAGDLYDGDWKDYNTGLFFVKQVSRLTSEGIRVVIVHGNHDAASSTTRTLRMPLGVVELDAKRADTFCMDEPPVAVHGRSYARREVTEDLSQSYPGAMPGFFNIGLLHTSLSGRAEHAPYAPCTVDGLRSKGYDYWALGHVHEREVVCEEPWIVFCGNLQGRHARETGPKGAMVVTVEDGLVSGVEHRALDTVRWAALQLDASEAESVEDVCDLVRDALTELVDEADGRVVAARVTVVGRSRAHAALSRYRERVVNEIRASAMTVSELVWVEKVALRTSAPVDLSQLLERDDAVGGLMRHLRQLRAEPERLAALAGELEELTRKLPPELLSGADALMLLEPDGLAELVTEAEQLLVPRLVGDEESQ